MSVLDWAEQECRIACKRENPNFDFNDPEHWQYNTHSMHQALCRGEEEKYKDIPELVSIAKYLSCILVAISE